MASKFKLRLKRNRRRQRVLRHKAEQLIHVQESSQAVLADVDRLIDRLVDAISSLQKARTTVLIQALASIKN